MKNTVKFLLPSGDIYEDNETGFIPRVGDRIAFGVIYLTPQDKQDKRESRKYDGSVFTVKSVTLFYHLEKIEVTVSLGVI